MLDSCMHASIWLGVTDRILCPPEAPLEAVARVKETASGPSLGNSADGAAKEHRSAVAAPAAAPEQSGKAETSTGVTAAAKSDKEAGQGAGTAVKQEPPSATKPAAAKPPAANGVQLHSSPFDILCVSDVKLKVLLQQAAGWTVWFYGGLASVV